MGGDDLHIFVGKDQVTVLTHDLSHQILSALKSHLVSALKAKLYRAFKSQLLYLNQLSSVYMLAEKHAEHWRYCGVFLL